MGGNPAELLSHGIIDRGQKRVRGLGLVLLIDDRKVEIRTLLGANMKRPVPDEIHGVPASLPYRVQGYIKNMNPIISLIMDHSIADGHHPDAVILTALPVVVGHGKGHEPLMGH